jgi:pimeloyl-ACP methyl ester carboxylesterase
LGIEFLEVPTGFEPVHEGFADLCLTAWLRHLLATPAHGFPRANGIVAWGVGGVNRVLTVAKTCSKLEVFMQDCFVEVNGLRIRYRCAGEHGSVLVLLHGIGRTLEDWSENMLALGRSYRVFAVDFPGCGFSDKPVLPYVTPFLAGFVRDFLRALGIERVTLIGNSMGGGISLEFSALFPELLERLVLVAPAGMGPKGAQFLGLCSIPVFGEVISRPSRLGSKRALEFLFADRSMMTEARAARDFELSSQPGATRAFLKMLRFMANRHGAKPAFYNRSLENASNVRVPTLIIWGVQDQILPVEYGPVAERIIPGSRLQIYDPCGHFPMLERAQDFNALLLEFLEHNFQPP